MMSEKNKKFKLSSNLTNELANIAVIRAAEQAKREALAKAARTIAERLASAAQETDKIKEQIVSEARAERKKLVQQAIDQAKADVKANVAEQEHASEEMIFRGEKYVSSAADFAVKYILGTFQENAN
jgi:hypothetical protein